MEFHFLLGILAIIIISGCTQTSDISSSSDSNNQSDRGELNSFKVMILFDIPDKFLDGESGIIAGGEVLSGTIKKGMVSEYQGKLLKVNFIELEHQYREKSVDGEFPAIGLTNLSSKNELSDGTILYFYEE